MDAAPIAPDAALGGQPATPPPVGRRSPWLAAGATIVAPVLGHVYAGKPLRGLAAWAVLLAVGPAALHASTVVEWRWGRILSLVIVVLVVAAVVADAARTARRADPAAPRRWYQHWPVYVGIVLAMAAANELALLPLVKGRWRAFSLQSGNMAPSLFAGDYVMTVRGTPPLRRGLVVTRMTDEGFESVNRMVGLPGDTLAMREGVLRVNGRAEPLEGRFRAVDDESGMFGWQRAFLAGDTAGYAPTAADWGPLVVPPGHVFTLGDNRPGSLDSRHLGFVPLERLTGRVDWIYFSRESLTREVRWNRIGRGVR